MTAKGIQIDCKKTTMDRSIDTDSVVGPSPRLFDVLWNRSANSTFKVYDRDEELGLIQDALLPHSKSFPRILLGTFGDDDALQEDKRLLTVLIKDPEASSVYFSCVIRDLALALGCMKLLKKTGKPKYKRSGWKVFKWLEKLHGKKASIAIGPYRLIHAERMAAEGGKHSWESI